MAFLGAFLSDVNRRCNGWPKETSINMKSDQFPVFLALLNPPIGWSSAALISAAQPNPEFLRL